MPEQDCSTEREREVVALADELQRIHGLARFDALAIAECKIDRLLDFAAQWDAEARIARLMAETACDRALAERAIAFVESDGMV
jgi:hypothetical protein